MNSKINIDLNPQNLIKDKEEFKRFLAVITAMELYSLEPFKKMEKMVKDFESLDQKYISKLPFNIEDRASKLKEAINHNQNLLNLISKIYKPDPSFYEGIDMDEMKNKRFEEEKYIYNVLTYIMRDWTFERKKEREECYNLIINEILKYFPPNIDNSINYKILIPDSAVNRLGYELCKYGFYIESNEYLFLNGIFTDFILKHAKKNEFSFCPNVDSFSNYYKEETVFRKYSFPDIDIDLEKDIKGKFKMTIGDFIDLYDNNNNYKNYFDCIITCYFIDTGQNIIRYIDIIYNILKKGGIWINFGPLSYHWSEDEESISIDLPYDKLKEVICNYGFKYINESFKTCTFGYIDNYMHNDYFKCIIFTVKKN